MLVSSNIISSKLRFTPIIFFSHQAVGPIIRYRGHGVVALSDWRCTGHALQIHLYGLNGTGHASVRYMHRHTSQGAGGLQPP